jgi:hypothetical protein
MLMDVVADISARRANSRTIGVFGAGFSGGVAVAVLADGF